MTPVFRPATTEDAAQAVQIIRNWAAETPWMGALDDPEPMAAFWRMVFEGGPAWVAEAQGRVLGFSARDEDNITGLYVAGSARRQGLGKRLLDLAKENRDWITVWAYDLNTEARRFYRREGLVEISRETVTYEDGVSLVDVEHRWTRTP